METNEQIAVSAEQYQQRREKIEAIIEQGRWDAGAAGYELPEQPLRYFTTK